MLMTQAYSSKFRTVDMFSQFQAHSSGITQEQFMHILNLLGRFIQIHAYLELLFTSARNVLRTFRHIDKVYISRNICPHSGIYQQIHAYSGY